MKSGQQVVNYIKKTFEKQINLTEYISLFFYTDSLGLAFRFTLAVLTCGVNVLAQLGGELSSECIC